MRNDDERERESHKCDSLSSEASHICDASNSIKMIKPSGSVSLPLTHRRPASSSRPPQATALLQAPLPLEQPLQASQPSQHADEPSGSQQESPILPLVLPTPSNHSTTGSTGTTGLAIRSIRCTFATTNLPTESGTAGTSSSNKRRGVVVGKKTAVITKEKGRTPVNYDDSVRGPPSTVRSRFVTDLSAYIKDRCPMLHPSWYDLPETERTRLLEFLSVNCDIDSRRKEFIVWIDEKAANRFREWKSYCHTDWQKKRDEPIPIEFAHRPAEWEWLCNHFRDPEFQKRSEQMKQIRASSNKKSHSGGAKPFVVRAEEHTKKGEQAPHEKTYVDVYKKFNPEVTKKEMCPLRLILIFLSATLVGFFVLRNLKSQPKFDDNDDAASVNTPFESSIPSPPLTPVKPSSNVFAVIKTGFWTCVDMACVKVQQASDEAAASLMASMPPIEDTSDGSSPASVTAPLLPRLHVDVEIGIMEKMVGPSRGTRVPGLGSGVSKEPRRRGPS
ncbi:hypothetical protein LguiB_012553 [Lonicera macranthoides]